MEKIEEDIFTEELRTAIMEGYYSDYIRNDDGDEVKDEIFSAEFAADAVI